MRHPNFGATLLGEGFTLGRVIMKRILFALVTPSEPRVLADVQLLDILVTVVPSGGNAKTPAGGTGGGAPTPTSWAATFSKGATLTADGKAKVAAAAKAILADNTITVSIVGHATASPPKKGSNDDVAKGRADAVIAELLDDGVDLKRI